MTLLRARKEWGCVPRPAGAAVALFVSLSACSHAPGPAHHDAGEEDGDSAGDSSSDMPTVLVGPSGDHSFLPRDLTVSTGTTVRWFWESAGHNVTSGAEGIADGLFCSPSDTGCASPPISNMGATYQHTFTVPGTFPYFCVPHYSVGMKATITVK